MKRIPPLLYYFINILDFSHRVSISLEQMRLLVRVGAFNFTGIPKKELLWKVHQLISPIKISNFHPELFKTIPKEFKLPTLDHSWIDDAYDEIELLGFPLCNPFLLVKNKPTHYILSKDFKSHINRIITVTAYLVTIKKTMTSKKEPMAFGTFLDEEGYWIDTVHFPPSLKHSSFRGPGIYVIEGRLVEEFDFLTIEVNSMKRLETLSKE